MKCPECQLSFIINKRESLEVNECPQCHGVWLKSGDIERMVGETQLIKQPEQNKSKSLSGAVNGIPTRQRKRAHFLSGAFDISGDW